MLKKVIKSVLLYGLLGIFASGLSAQQLPVSNEDEQDERNQHFIQTSGTRPQTVLSENEPRLELLKIGYDLQEVAGYTAKRAKEEMQVVEIVKKIQTETLRNANTVSLSTSGSTTFASINTGGNSSIQVQLKDGLSQSGFSVVSGGRIVTDTSLRSPLASTLVNSISKEQFDRVIHLIAPPQDAAYFEKQYDRLKKVDAPPSNDTVPEPPPINTTPSEPNLSVNVPVGLPPEMLYQLFPELRPSPDEIFDVFADASQLVNHLLTDAKVGSGILDGNRVFTRGRLVANSFNYSVVEEIAARAGHEEIAQNIISALKDEKLNAHNQYSAKLSDLFSDTLNTDILGARKFGNVGDLFGLTTEDFMLFAAKDLSFEPGSVVDVSRREGEYGTIWHRNRIVVLGASDDVLIDGDVTFTNHGSEPMDEALAIGGAGDLVIQNSFVNHDGSNLGLGGGNRVVILKSSIETRDHLGIGSLGDIDIVDSVLKAGEGNRVLMYANDNLNATGLEFSDGLRQVYMDATTINLTDVDFPAGSEVRLVSQLGGIDGKYPNFGFSEPGRVNFIEDVSYGGVENKMMDRASFDQFGENISIESFNP